MLLGKSQTSQNMGDSIQTYSKSNVDQQISNKNQSEHSQKPLPYQTVLTQPDLLQRRCLSKVEANQEVQNQLKQYYQSFFSGSKDESGLHNQNENSINRNSNRVTERQYSNSGSSKPYKKSFKYKTHNSQYQSSAITSNNSSNKKLCKQRPDQAYEHLISAEKESKSCFMTSGSKDEYIKINEQPTMTGTSLYNGKTQLLKHQVPEIFELQQEMSYYQVHGESKDESQAIHVNSNLEYNDLVDNRISNDQEDALKRSRSGMSQDPWNYDRRPNPQFHIEENKSRSILDSSGSSADLGMECDEMINFAPQNQAPLTTTNNENYYIFSEEDKISLRPSRNIETLNTVLQSNQSTKATKKKSSQLIKQKDQGNRIKNQQLSKTFRMPLKASFGQNSNLLTETKADGSVGMNQTDKKSNFQKYYQQPITQRSKVNDHIIKPYGNGTELSMGGFVSKRDTKGQSMNSARSEYTSLSNNLALEVQLVSELNGPENFVECSQSSKVSATDAREKDEIMDLTRLETEIINIQQPQVQNIDENIQANKMVQQNGSCTLENPQVQNSVKPIYIHRNVTVNAKQNLKNIEQDNVFRFTNQSIIQASLDGHLEPALNANGNPEDDKIIVPLIVNLNCQQKQQSFLSVSAASISISKTSVWNIEGDQINLPSQIHKSIHSNLNNSPPNQHLAIKNSFKNKEFMEIKSKDCNTFINLKQDDNQSGSLLCDNNSIRNLTQFQNLLSLGSFQVGSNNKNQSFDHLAILNKQTVAMLASLPQGPDNYKDIERHSFDFEDKDSMIHNEDKQLNRRPQTCMVPEQQLMGTSHPDFNVLNTLTEGTEEEEKSVFPATEEEKSVEIKQELERMGGVESRNDYKMQLLNTLTHTHNTNSSKNMTPNFILQNNNTLVGSNNPMQIWSNEHLIEQSELSVNQLLSAVRSTDKKNSSSFSKFCLQQNQRYNQNSHSKAMKKLEFNEDTSSREQSNLCYKVSQDQIIKGSNQDKVRSQHQNQSSTTSYDVKFIRNKVRQCSTINQGSQMCEYPSFGNLKVKAKHRRDQSLDELLMYSSHQDTYEKQQSTPEHIYKRKGAMNLDDYKQNLRNQLDFDNLATPSLKGLLSNQHTTILSDELAFLDSTRKSQISKQFLVSERKRQNLMRKFNNSLSKSLGSQVTAMIAEESHNSIMQLTQPENDDDKVTQKMRISLNCIVLQTEGDEVDDASTPPCEFDQYSDQSSNASMDICDENCVDQSPPSDKITTPLCYVTAQKHTLDTLSNLQTERISRNQIGLENDYQQETVPELKNNLRSVLSPSSSVNNKKSFRLFHNQSTSDFISPNKQNLFYKINKMPEVPPPMPKLNIHKPSDMEFTNNINHSILSLSTLSKKFNKEFSDQKKIKHGAFSQDISDKKPAASVVNSEKQWISHQQNFCPGTFDSRQHQYTQRSSANSWYSPSIDRSKSIIAQEAFQKAMDMNIYLLKKLDELQKINEMQSNQLYYQQQSNTNTNVNTNLNNSRNHIRNIEDSNSSRMRPRHGSCGDLLTKQNSIQQKLNENRQLVTQVHSPNASKKIAVKRKPTKPYSTEQSIVSRLSSRILSCVSKQEEN